MFDFFDTSNDGTSDVHAQASKYYTTGIHSKGRTRTYVVSQWSCQSFSLLTLFFFFFFRRKETTSS